MFKYIMLFSALLWTVNVWIDYADVRAEKQEVVAVHEPVAVTEEPIFFPRTQTTEQSLSDEFWQWEAKGQLSMIDAMLDDQTLSHTREHWEQVSLTRDEIYELANHLTSVQYTAYGVVDKLKPATIKFIPLRGDANGLYIPNEQTIYLNTRMVWRDLPFERFVEVILHENMHHIMTTMVSVLSNEDSLYVDFAALTRASSYHGGTGMAQDRQDIYQTNPQELVAWRTQRAARFAGIMGAGLSAWDMTARMQDLKIVQRDAGYKN